MSELKGIPESMLIPLAAKARETLSDMPIIDDPLSVKIIKEINNSVLDTYVDWLSQLGISIRTEILDEIVINFINHANHPFIINIGCGLDTRLSRLKLNNIPWIDIDVPESINLRKRFFNETYFYKMINKSMFDYTWIDDVKRNVHFKEDSDILIIFEGVLMYFEKLEIEALYKAIARSFDTHHLVIASRILFAIYD
ncbi:class I SAM-dependent methyltransferase [Mammaliicoccus sciuri]|nr:class I SAM-dependent methyltransferase [Mammaliicoccus sciuri]